MSFEISRSEQLLYSTVRIECLMSNGQGSVGTGFFFRFLQNGDTFIPAIVTNKHVVEGASLGKFLLTLADDEGNPINTEHFTLEFQNFQSMWIPHPDSNIDLCIMPLAPILQRLNEMKKNVFFISLGKEIIPSYEDLAELMAIEDITMIGYPSGLWDSVNNMPIIRRGITATHPKVNYEGNETTMIDAACYNGSSGSPVFIFNEGTYPTKDAIVAGSRTILLGILFAGPQFTVNGEVRVVDIPTSQTTIAESRIPMNLGLIVKSYKLLDFEKILLELEN